MFRNGIIVLLIILAGSRFVSAQKVEIASGKSQVVLTDRMSLDEARESARQLAIINAIENEFGTYVEQDASTYIEGGRAEFRIIGNTRVKGEWLKTLDEKFSVVKKRAKGQKRPERDTWIMCEVKGTVREVVRPAVDLKFLPLNCPDAGCRTYDFVNGEPFYLYFRTPVDGNLAVFISQEDGRVYRLLPYKIMKGDLAGEVPVKSDKDYLFFASGDQYNYFGNASYQAVDEMYMEASGDREVMEMYIIFSPDRFDKPLLDSDRKNPDTLPLYVHENDFESWLSENRIYDPAFTFRKVSLTVTK